MLSARSRTEEEALRAIQTRVSRTGIDRARVIISGLQPTGRDHLARYLDVDIALDTFPYNGTTTTCEALYMGVPVVTRAGGVHRSRVGLSIVSAAGLSHFAVMDQATYVATAIGMARDVDRLRAGRPLLRASVRTSALMDVGRFVAELEDAYHGMWQR